MRLFGVLIAIVAAIVILVIAFSPTSNETNDDIEYGPKALTGVLLKADVSLTRRGTHILAMSETDVVYVESKTVNLTPLEGQTVFITGNLEPNIRPSDRPVLIVETATPAFTIAAVKKWDIPALKASLEAPAHWKGTVSGETATFTIGESAESLLVIRGNSGSGLPPGKTFFLGSRQGSRLQTGTAQDVYIKDKGMILHLHFDAAFQEGISRLEDTALLADQFEKLIKSITFFGDPVTSSASRTGSGSVGGIVCGGIAGVLCPSGYFCEITNTTVGEGVCRKR